MRRKVSPGQSQKKMSRQASGFNLPPFSVKSGNFLRFCTPPPRGLRLRRFQPRLSVPRSTNISFRQGTPKVQPGMVIVLSQIGRSSLGCAGVTPRAIPREFRGINQVAMLRNRRRRHSGNHRKSIRSSIVVQEIRSPYQENLESDFMRL